MYTSDVIKVSEIGVNIEIAKDSSLKTSDALEVVKIVTGRGNHVTIKKSYHSADLIQMAEIGRNNITIVV
jgi:hypothetical protein